MNTKRLFLVLLKQVLATIILCAAGRETGNEIPTLHQNISVGMIVFTSIFGFCLLLIMLILTYDTAFTTVHVTPRRERRGYQTTPLRG
jgi:hypothetical protein